MKENHPKITEVKQVTRSMARQYSEWMLATFSGNTHNKYIVLLSAIWDSIKARESESDRGNLDDRTVAGISINPWAAIEREPVAIHPRRELTFDEIRKLYDSVSGEMRTLVAVGIYTGLRLKDALLSWDSIDMEKGIIEIRPHKIERKMALKNEWIRIPILPDLYEILADVPVEKRHGYVMPALTKVYNRSSSLMSYRISSMFRACGIKTHEDVMHGRKKVSVGFHSLRHTFVSIAVRHGIPMGTIQNLVGHASEKMTKHYLHLSDESIRAEMRLFPRLLSNDCRV
jgi:integrase